MSTAEERQVDHSDRERFRLSDGEINHFWWFSFMGSIMDPFTRRCLRRTWGFCERHAWGFLVTEGSFRDNYFHGPAILYEDMIAIAHKHLRRGLIAETNLRARLKSRDTCLLCQSGLGPHSISFARKDRIVQGRNTWLFKIFARETEHYWSQWVCHKCLGREKGGELCRVHLLGRISKGESKDIEKQRALIERLHAELQLYSRSFRWEYHDTETTGNKASLIGAVGWCSGWRTLFDILEC